MKYKVKKHLPITEIFGHEVACILSEKIKTVHKSFDAKSFYSYIIHHVKNKRYQERVEIVADAINKHLPKEYSEAISILRKIFGPPNPHETGMFKNYYWLLPIAKYVEKYGINHFNISIQTIAEVTKRCTGEYAIRAFAKKYPNKTLNVCTRWALHQDFHLRRLASEGLRPKLPWAKKLYLWNDNPDPIFKILELLKEDEVRFVKKSVANHLRDWTKINPHYTNKILSRWSKSRNPNTIWIVQYAQRK